MVDWIWIGLNGKRFWIRNEPVSVHLLIHYSNNSKLIAHESHIFSHIFLAPFQALNTILNLTSWRSYVSKRPIWSLWYGPYDMHHLIWTIWYEETYHINLYEFNMRITLSFLGALTIHFSVFMIWVFSMFNFIWSQLASELLTPL